MQHAGGGEGGVDVRIRGEKKGGGGGGGGGKFRNTKSPLSDVVKTGSSWVVSTLITFVGPVQARQG